MHLYSQIRGQLPMELWNISWKYDTRFSTIAYTYHDIVKEQNVGLVTVMTQIPAYSFLSLKKQDTAVKAAVTGFLTSTWETWCVIISMTNLFILMIAGSEWIHKMSKLRYCTSIQVSLGDRNQLLNMALLCHSFCIFPTIYDQYRYRLPVDDW